MQPQMERQRRLETLIERRNVRVLFQPIVDLNDGMIFAFEALSRPGADSGFSNADELFEAAEECGLLWELEQVTRNLSMHEASNWPRDVRLFLNSSPQVFADPRFATVVEQDLSRVDRLSPERIVLEITERSEQRFTDALSSQVEIAKRLGFGVAVDDAGAGTSGLNRMMVLRPQWIKLDRQLVCGIDKDAYKQNLVRFFVHFSRMSGVNIVAEGIEQPDELATLMSMGVRYGQGYYLARPAEKALAMDPAMVSDVRERWARVDTVTPPEPHGLQLCRIAHPAAVVPGSAVTIAQAMTKLEVTTGASGVVVQEGRRVIGWVGKANVEMAFRDGRADALVASLSKGVVCPLSPEATVQDALQMVCTREDQDMGDPIVLASGSDVVGVVAMRDLLRAATAESRPASSGLRAAITGLPARVRADQHMEQMILRGADAATRMSKDFHSDAAFVDVRRFADYNSVFGYEMGDRLIRSLSELLHTVVVRGEPDVFLAHLGDDRFLLTARSGVLHSRLNQAMLAFERSSPSLTDPSVIDHLTPPSERSVEAADGPRMGLRVLLMPDIFAFITHPRDVYRTEQQLRQKCRTQEATLAAGTSLLVVDRRSTASAQRSAA